MFILLCLAASFSQLSLHRNASRAHMEMVRMWSEYSCPTGKEQTKCSVAHRGSWIIGFWSEVAPNGE